MIIHTNPDNIYEDPTFGSYGFIICGLLPVFLMFLYGLYLSCFLILTEPPALTENYIGILTGLIFMTGAVFWIGSNIRYASQTAQKIAFDENYLFIRLYFLRKKFFSIKNLKSINDFPITKLMAQADTFPREGTGFFIEFKNGKKYRISPNMQNFDTLKSKLLGIIQNNNQ